MDIDNVASQAYLKKMKTDGVVLKVFLSNGTMLTGLVKDYDDASMVLDKCLVFNEHIISIKPAG
jgi:sRNA-binding regulator protein Hfq